jgi:hypothetical protein
MKNGIVKKDKKIMRKVLLLTAIIAINPYLLSMNPELEDFRNFNESVRKIDLKLVNMEDEICRLRAEINIRDQKIARLRKKLRQRQSGADVAATDDSSALRDGGDSASDDSSALRDGGDSASDDSASGLLHHFAAAHPAPVVGADCSTFEGLVAYMKNKISTAQKFGEKHRNFDIAFLFRRNLKATFTQKLNAIAGNKEQKAAALIDLVNKMPTTTGDKPNKFVGDIIKRLDFCLRKNNLHRFKTQMFKRPSPVLNLRKFVVKNSNG